MKIYIPVIVFAAVFVIGISDLAAKPLSRIIRDIGLTPDDFSMLSAAGESLYATTSLRSGKVAAWTNPDSNSHGTVKLVAVRENCVYLQHFVFPKGDSKPKEVRLRMCRNAKGIWQLQP